MKTLSQLGISPAPWHVGNVETNRIYHFNDYAIATCQDFCLDRVLEDANARLIAAAPDLYEQLRDAVNDQCHDCDHRDDDFNCHNGCYCKIWKWRAALAKASGESEASA